MTTISRIAFVRRGSDGPFDARSIRRTTDNAPYYASLPTSLVAALKQVVHATPDVEAVVEVSGRRLTYSELWNLGHTVAGGLHAAGIRPGDRIAIDLPNGVDWVVACVGIVMCGAVVVPVNARLAAPERAQILASSGVSLVIDSDTPAPAGAPYLYERAERGDLAAIFYTSGTTGRSKGATSTHEALLGVAENMRRAAGIPAAAGGGLRTLVCVPLFHVTGFAAQMVTTLLTGGTVVILNGLDAARMMQTIAAERISLMIAVPAIYYYALSSPHFRSEAMASVRWALYGGAPIAPELVARLKEAMPNAWVGNGFGMSETSSLATMLPDQDSHEHADSIGYPCPCIDVGLLDRDESTGVGEILVRGQTVTHGYWEDPVQTERTFINGWLRTGDVGWIDNAGRVYLVDRLKDMINRGGENVFSVEVENALADAPGVSEVAVLGVPDSMMGEKVGCVIVASQPEFDVNAVLRHAAARLADYKVPQFVAVREQPLPRNPAGKVLKHRLRDEVEWGRAVR
jgi:acyl-CoA synthetase (AMP-forming)/AMP-acid ligase II